MRGIEPREPLADGRVDRTVDPGPSRQRVGGRILPGQRCSVIGRHVQSGRGGGVGGGARDRVSGGGGSDVAEGGSGGRGVNCGQAGRGIEGGESGAGDDLFDDSLLTAFGSQRGLHLLTQQRAPHPPSRQALSNVVHELAAVVRAVGINDLR